MNPIIEKLIKPRKEGSVALCWLGNIGWLCRTATAFFAFDLDIDGAIPRLEPSPITADDLSGTGLDCVFYTHEHGDHFNRGTARAIMEACDCMFVLPESCLDAASDVGIPADRIITAQPRSAFKHKSMVVTPVRALHGHYLGSVYNGANLQDCGYHIASGGVSLFQPGDSVLLHDHGAMPPVDVLFVSPTEHNMQVEKSLIIVDWVNPAHVVAQHFGTYVTTAENAFWTRGYEKELKTALPGGTHYRIPAMGKIIEIDIK